MTFGEKLKSLRQNAKKSQEELATLLNVSKANISKYESDSIEPNLGMIKKIAEYFGVSSDYLIGVTDKHEFPPCRIAAFMEKGESVESFCNRIGIDVKYFHDLESGDALIDHKLAEQLSDSKDMDIKFIYGLKFKTKKPETMLHDGIREDYANFVKDSAKWDLYKFQQLGGYFTDAQKIPCPDSFKLSVTQEERDGLLRMRNGGGCPSNFEMALISAYRKHDEATKAGICNILHLNMTQNAISDNPTADINEDIADTVKKLSGSTVSK